MSAREATVRGVAMRWTEAGQGFPVVLIHGIPTSPALWRRVLPQVRGGHCLAFEMVGYGDSIPAGRDRDISVARQADYLLGWLEQLGVERAILVGHDLGGGVAQIAAVRAPRRCAGLVLANSIAYDSWPIPSVRALRAARPVTRRLPMPAFKALLASLVARGHDNPAIARESLAVHLEPYRRQASAAALAWQVRWLRTADTLAVADGLRQLQVPARWCGAPSTRSRSCPMGSGWPGICAASCGASRGAGISSPRTTPNGWPPPSTRSSAPWTRPADLARAGGAGRDRHQHPALREQGTVRDRTTGSKRPIW